MIQAVKTALWVIVLSCLIWVFAEQQVTQTESVEVEIGLLARPELLVEYLNEQDEIIKDTIREVVLQVEGPAQKIQQAQRAARERRLPKITLDAKELGYVPTGPVPQNYTTGVVRELLDRTLKLEGGTVHVTQADPPNLRIRVTKLIRQEIPVRVLDEQGSELTTLNPVVVQAYVLIGQASEATVELNVEQRIEAVLGPLSVTANLKLPNRIEQYPVEIQLKEQTSSLASVTIPQPRLYIAMPPSMTGHYEVIWDDSQLNLYSPIKCEGPSLQALDNYKNSNYHLILEIVEDDKNRPEISRKLRYYLPEDCQQVQIIAPRYNTVRFQLQEIGKRSETPGEPAPRLFGD